MIYTAAYHELVDVHNAYLDRYTAIMLSPQISQSQMCPDLTKHCELLLHITPCILFLCTSYGV